MRIGVHRETKPQEARVGDGAGFADKDHTRVGTALADSADEVFERARTTRCRCSRRSSRLPASAADQLAVAG